MRTSVRAREPTPERAVTAKRAALGRKQAAMRQMRLGALPTLRSEAGLAVGARGVLSLDGEKFEGVRGPLREAFWPTFSRKTAERKSQYGASCDIGLRVEAQISSWCATGKRPSLNYARLFCAWMKREGMTLVSEQQAICDPAARVGTRIDFVLRDRGGDLVLVELKVGYNYLLDKAQGKMVPRGELPSVPCTIRNQCYFQLAWMHEVCARRYNCTMRPLLVILTPKLIKRLGVGRIPVAELAVKIVGKKIARELPKPLRRVAPAIRRVIEVRRERRAENARRVRSYTQHQK